MMDFQIVGSLTTVSLPWRLTAFYLVVVLPLGLTGCGLSGRASLSGEVRYGSELVSDGAVRLVAIQGTDGHGAVARVVDGHYAFPIDKMLLAGLYRVEIRGMRKTGAKESERDDETDKVTRIIDVVENFIPPRYNAESELQVTLKPGHNSQDFLLTE
jgi:hypothetical protein